uniref:Uncharacterized protein n=1 Tax=Anguilla anguilla TaxID=7936 RepID=A0A0E9TUS2_ANGAN
MCVCVVCVCVQRPYPDSLLCFSVYHCSTVVARRHFASVFECNFPDCKYFACTM